MEKQQLKSILLEQKMEITELPEAKIIQRDRESEAKKALKNNSGVEVASGSEIIRKKVCQNSK